MIGRRQLLDVVKRMPTGADGEMLDRPSRTLVARGTKVVAVDINDAAGGAVGKDLGGNVIFLSGDVSKPETASKAVELAITKFGRPTGVVNNAHASQQKPFTIWSRRTGTCPSAKGSRQRKTSCSPRTRT